MIAQEAVTAILREEMARRRLKRSALAEKARISLSSLEKSLAGRRPFTHQTLVRLEDALGCNLREARRISEAAAPHHLGGYARKAVRAIAGSYLTLRPSFGDATALYAYRTDIAWHDTASHLVFREVDRIDVDYSQAGDVSMPYQTGLIYLVTNRHGQYRLAVLSRLTMEREMLGLITTLRCERGGQLLPVSTPIALVPAERFGEPMDRGRIDCSHPLYGEYLAILRKAEANAFATLQTVQPCGVTPPSPVLR